MNFLSASLGVPFAISADRNSTGTAPQDHDLIVTVTGYLPDHYLVRVKPDGTYAKIADLTQVCTQFGAPFGVAVYQKDYFVTLSTDVTEAVGQIAQVSADGTISQQIKLDERGNPFGIAVQTDEFVVAQSKGLLLRVTQTGKVSRIVDLQKAGCQIPLSAKFGIPSGIVVYQNDLVVTTNSGYVLKLSTEGI